MLDCPCDSHYCDLARDERTHAWSSACNCRCCSDPSDEWAIKCYWDAAMIHEKEGHLCAVEKYLSLAEMVELLGREGVLQYLL